MEKILSFICDELDELERKADKDGKLSMAEMQYVDLLAHTKKNLMKAEEMSDDYSNGYDNRGYSRRGSYGGRYEGSYARGRKRDSMGRYSRNYSMATDNMVDELRDMMMDAPDEHTKKEFQKFISKIENM